MKTIKTQLLTLLFLFTFGSVYSQKTGCISGDCNNGTGVYLLENGNKYDGEWQNRKRVGQGTFTFTNGMTYIGE